MIHHGDCLDVMATFEAESVSAIVTDPPYGLGFMGKAWDHGQPGIPFWAEMFRIAKPGAHLLAFGGTRTVHRLAAAIEDAGWEIRDMLVWGYASGFPKSLDVSKAIDRAAGAEREVVGTYDQRSRLDGSTRKPAELYQGSTYNAATDPGRQSTVREISHPATPDAEKWNGWGTALKPAWEPIILARKPLRGTVAANVLRHGTGALNIDGTRIGTGGGTTRGDNGSNAGKPRNTLHGGNFGVEPIDGGRWPANVILTDPIFDGGVGGVVGGGEQHTHPGTMRNDSAIGGYNGTPSRPAGTVLSLDDSGTYSRFFLIPKAARSDREPLIGDRHERDHDSVLRTTPGALESHPELGDVSVRSARVARRAQFGEHSLRDVGTTPRVVARSNVHPTVKPLDLMRHLVRLVTPPGGLVLDPFLGSGTTALACEMEGFPWLGIEKEAEYVAIAEARLNGVQKGLGLVG